jgi:hypothetical protein
MWRWEQVAAWLEKPEVGVELGVKEGRFTEYLLGRFPHLYMVAVDLWQPREDSGLKGFETYREWDFGTIRADFDRRTRPYRGRVRALVCDTVDAASYFADGKFDFVFIDAEHTYEGVRDDIRAWRPKIKAGGILCGHDYCGKFMGVCEAVNELKEPIITGANDTWMIRC